MSIGLKVNSNVETLSLAVKMFDSRGGEHWLDVKFVPQVLGGGYIGIVGLDEPDLDILQGKVNVHTVWVNSLLTALVDFVSLDSKFVNQFLEEDGQQDSNPIPVD